MCRELLPLLFTPAKPEACKERGISRVVQLPFPVALRGEGGRTWGWERIEDGWHIRATPRESPKAFLRQQSPLPTEQELVFGGVRSDLPYPARHRPRPLASPQTPREEIPDDDMFRRTSLFPPRLMSQDCGSTKKRCDVTTPLLVQ